MVATKSIGGFSKLSKSEKIDWLLQHFIPEDADARLALTQFWLQDEALQQVLDGFSENTVSNFPMPYGIAPNFLINNQLYAVPMVIEESSVVAAASSAAKFWLPLGGFETTVKGMVKLGQLHLRWGGSPERWGELFPRMEAYLHTEVEHLTHNMRQRGGGVLGMEWKHLPEIASDYYQIIVRFATADSMGANFINTVLEQFGLSLEQWLQQQNDLAESEQGLQVVMAILSNYTPECLVNAKVGCTLKDMERVLHSSDVQHFSEKFAFAVHIARHDPYRAVTHNKGIFNGIDAVVLATGNDFRAVEACGHAYAARDGQYRSLSKCTLEGGYFQFEMDIPLALGTVGGLTKLHPLAKLSLQILGNPGAEQLMQIVAATGLAQNFGAVRSLVTTGIQAGHMKMHLQNILIHLGAKPAQVQGAIAHFSDKTVTFSDVRGYLEANP